MSALPPAPLNAKRQRVRVHDCSDPTPARLGTRVVNSAIDGRTSGKQRCVATRERAVHARAHNDIIGTRQGSALFSATSVGIGRRGTYVLSDIYVCAHRLTHRHVSMPCY